MLTPHLQGRRRRISLVRLALLGLVVAGCVGAIERDEFDALIQERGGGVTTPLLDDALAAVEQRLGTTDLELRSLTISLRARTVTMEVRDPSNRQDLDRVVTVAGKVRSQEPVQLSATETLEGVTFRPADLPALADLESAADAALVALDFKDSYVTSISVTGTRRPLELHVSVDSPRARGVARFSSDGTLLEATRT